jgi:nucleoside-diphosphate-sugar epimerase
MKLLVSGATGFLGQNVLPYLSKLDHEVFLIIRDEKEIEILSITYPSFTMICYDYLSESGDPIRNMSFDIFLNLAWGRLDNFYSPWHMDQELPAQKKLLLDVIAAGVKSVVSIGTCLEYSNLSGEIHESDLCEPTIPYAVAKNELRKYLEFVCKSKLIKYCWVRLFYFYGPGQQPRTLYGQLENAVKSGQESFIASTNGNQRLDYTHIDEVARKLVWLLFSRSAEGEINLSSGNSQTLREIVNKWIIDENWKILFSWGSDTPRTYESNSFWGSNEKFQKFHDQELRSKFD